MHPLHCFNLPSLWLTVAAAVGVSGIGHLRVVRRFSTLHGFHSRGWHFVHSPNTSPCSEREFLAQGRILQSFVVPSDRDIHLLWELLLNFFHLKHEITWIGHVWHGESDCTFTSLPLSRFMFFWENYSGSLYSIHRWPVETNIWENEAVDGNGKVKQLFLDTDDSRCTLTGPRWCCSGAPHRKCQRDIFYLNAKQ